MIAIASVDFGALHSAVSSIPTMIAVVWMIFGSVPFALVAARSFSLLAQRIRPSNVRVAKNGRLYCVVAGRPPVWARKGETAMALAMRCASL